MRATEEIQVPNAPKVNHLLKRAMQKLGAKVGVMICAVPTGGADGANLHLVSDGFGSGHAMATAIALLEHVSRTREKQVHVCEHCDLQAALAEQAASLLRGQPPRHVH